MAKKSQIMKIANKFKFSQSSVGIFGHSMGGGGAIQCALKNELYN